MSMRFAIGLGAVALAVAATGAAEAQQRIGQNRFWSVFKTDTENGPVCYAATAPTATDFSQKVDSRGQAFLMISFWPKLGVKGEVSVISGYPMNEAQPVDVAIGGNAFRMFAVGDGAWLETREQDAKMVQAMRAGSEAVITGVSGRDTKVRDTFSLLGFTASAKAAEAACR